MKPISICFAGLFLAAAVLRADEKFDQAIDKATLDYVERLRKATAELATTRERVEREKAPWLKKQRAAEDRLLAAESNVARYQALERQLGDLRNRLIKSASTLHKNSTYVNSLAQDSITAFRSSLAPGEENALGEPLAAIERSLSEQAGPVAAMDAADFLLGRVRESLGGYTARGGSTFVEGNEVKQGTFAFVGPQTFFRADSGEAGVVVRLREGSAVPVTYPVKEWSPATAQALFEKGKGEMAADATGNKALRLQQTTGTLWQHIEKGGYVAYAILVVGLLAAGLILAKLRDIARLAVDDAATVHAFLRQLAVGGTAAATAQLGQLKASTRELFAAGLAHAHAPKVALEEHLQALLLRQRLEAERRLPLLAVIATAAPLMGLLGTVVGMVKTFALITVFGTGNAGKLASGISEVLVATELGLAVAIPTLVIHGFISHRIHRRLATLERYALEFVTVAKSERAEAAEAVEA